MLYYEQDVLDILRTADKPMLKREIAERIPDGQEYRNCLNIGAAVSKLYRAGALDRVQVGRHHNMYAYSIAARPRIEAGHTMNLELSTWDDGTIRLTYWDMIGGRDRIFILGDDGRAYEEDVVEARHPVDLVAALRKMVQEGN